VLATTLEAATMSATRKLFVNLSVKDVTRATTFFQALGFEFNSQFSSEHNACMVLSDDAYVMLLAEPRFRDFTDRDICDTSRYTEGLFAVSAGSRAEVDQLVHIALANGGAPAQKPMDHGFMYGWSFYDPDGHHWEVFWMDPAAVSPQPSEVTGTTA
jgi:predicted lactoylglutathione lyase